jgi:hypothetical protein
MPLKGKLTAGKSCQITIDCSPAMPGTSAVAIVWIPKPNTSAPLPIVTSIAPGARIQQTVAVPDAQMLLVDVDLPIDGVSTMTLTVAQDATTIAIGPADSDTEWTFLVAP